jgi:hypothetical protein
MLPGIYSELTPYLSSLLTIFTHDKPSLCKSTHFILYSPCIYADLLRIYPVFTQDIRMIHWIYAGFTQDLR